jgi:ribonuclease HI
LEVLGSSAQTLSNGLLRYPKTNKDVTPWMNQLKCILTHNGFPPNSTCYTDGSFKQSKGSMWQYINSTTIPSEPAAGMVYTYPDENWKEKPILIIHISQGQELEGDSVYPMELLALICALRMAKFLDHPHSIVTDSQSSIDTVKPVLGESHLHFRNYSQAHITIGARGSLPAPHQVTIVKVKSHVEKRKRDRHEWTQHEEGNVLADVAASSAPDQLKKQYPTSTNITITASELIFQICPSDIWNVYKSPMTPVPWTFITQSRQARNHTQYLQTRTENSARIHRNRDWTEFNMQLTSELWKNDDATTLDKQRSLKIIYDLY